MLNHMTESLTKKSDCSEPAMIIKNSNKESDDNKKAARIPDHNHPLLPFLSDSGTKLESRIYLLSAPTLTHYLGN